MLAAFRPLPLLALAVPLALAGCVEDPPTPEQTATPVATGPRTLVAAGFNDQSLGPKIAGPQGTEIASALTLDGRALADLKSYVACPAPAEGETAAEECRPEAQAEDAVYTYVHRVTPRDTEAAILAFRTNRPVGGFANVVGFDRSQAEAALGEDYAIGVQEDNGALIWRIESGGTWDEGDEITFFWQSTRPPEGPAEAYLLETATGMAQGTGPVPAAAEPAAEGEDDSESD